MDINTQFKPSKKSSILDLIDITTAESMSKQETTLQTKTS